MESSSSSSISFSSNNVAEVQQSPVPETLGSLNSGGEINVTGKAAVFSDGVTLHDSVTRKAVVCNDGVMHHDSVTRKAVVCNDGVTHHDSVTRKAAVCSDGVMHHDSVTRKAVVCSDGVTLHDSVTRKAVVCSDGVMHQNTDGFVAASKPAVSRYPQKHMMGYTERDRMVYDNLLYAWIIHQQHMYMQLMYTQLMYMQYYQYVYAVNQSFSRQSAPQQDQSLQVVQAAAANNAGPADQPNHRVNRRPQIVDEEGEPIDLIYATFVIMRMLLLLGIIFFYFNLLKFTTFLGGCLVVYLLQGFRRILQNPEEEAARQAADEPNEVQAEVPPPEAANEQAEVPPPEAVNEQAEQQQQPPPAEQHRYSRLLQILKFILGMILLFFSSLIPDPVDDVDL